MRQEHRFVAELYRYLAPFIDTTREVFLSLDGMAARQGVGVGHFLDPDVPDMWFTVVGADVPTLLEAKVLSGTNSVELGRRQLAAWRTGGAGKHLPHAWVATTRNLDQFFYWSHADFILVLDASTATNDPVPLQIPPQRRVFTDIRQLALHVLAIRQEP